VTAVTPAVRAAVLARAESCCERCYVPLDGVHGYSLQHRAARRMGGSKLAHLAQAPNLLALCGSGTTQCHGWVEDHPTDAYSQGLALRTGWNPDQTPYCDIHGRWWLLTDDTKREIQPPWGVH
jgi:hypothetical protein